jgi:hypothetical protein
MSSNLKEINQKKKSFIHQAKLYDETLQKVPDSSAPLEWIIN